MIKKIIPFLLVLILLASLFSACSTQTVTDEPPQNGARDYTDFFGKTIGVAIGSVSDQVTQDQMKATSAYYSELSAGIEDVRRGRIDGFMTDLSTLRIIVGSDGNEDLECLEVPADFFEGPMGAISTDQNIIDRFNAFLAELDADGTLADMQNRWLKNVPDLDSPMPDIPLTGANGTFKVATCGEKLPFSYVGANSELKGYSIELTLRFAQREGMNVEFAEMEFGGLIPFVLSGKADFAIANISITEERKKSVLFTDPIYSDQFGILTLKTGGGVKDEDSAASSRDYTEFLGKKIGVNIGVVSDKVIENNLAGTPAYYTSIAIGIEDVRNARLDGYIWDLSAARVYVGSVGNEDLECIEVPSEFFFAPLGAFSTDQNTIDSFNAFLAELKADGTLEDMQNRWLENVPDLETPMPEIPLTGQNGTLKVAICGTEIPFTYVGNNNEYKGYSIELAIRYAAHEGMNIEFADMDFSGMIPYVVSGKADLGIANVTITEERKKSVLFTDSIYDDMLGIVTLKKDGKANAVSESSGRAYTDFAGKKIGVATGTIWDQLTENQVKGVPVYYSDMSAAIEDVRKGRIDGYMADLSEARVFTAQPGKEDLAITAIPSEIFAAPMGAISNNQDVIDRFNVFLAKVKADGTLAEMQNRWLENIPDLDSPMPDIPLTGENGVLKVSTSGLALPFSYVGSNNELKGYSVELAMRFAAHEGMDIDITTIDYSGLITSVAAGKTDISIDATSITEERKKSVLFSDSIYDDQAAIISLKQDSAQTAAKDGFINWVKTGVENNLITDNRWKMIVDGLGITMTISLAAQVLGTLFGCVVCFVLTRRNKLARWIGNLYCGLIHGTPVVVLLMITYYIIFGNSEISGVTVAVAAFTMVEGAIIAQNLKGAIETVDPVEIEAARSIGFSAFRAFLAVTLPQAVRRALPSYTNGFVELVKSTAIVGYIAIQDLTRAGDIIRSRTYDAYFPLLLIALIYLTVTAVCVQIFKFAVKKINGGEMK